MIEKNVFKEEIMVNEICSLIVPKEKVITVKAKWNLRKAFDKLMESGWSSVPVLNEKDEVEGIINKHLILQNAKGDKVPYYLDFNRKQVRESMQNRVPTLSEDTILHYGIELLVDYAYIPVVNNEKKFVGILTRKSVLDYLLKIFYDEE